MHRRLYAGVRAIVLELRSRPFSSERDLASPRSARFFNLFVGSAMLVAACIRWFDPAAFATPWPWLVAPIAGFLFTHAVVSPSGVSFIFTSPVMIVTIVHGASTGIAALLLIMPMILLRGGSTWRTAGRHAISTGVSCVAIFFLVEVTAMLMSDASPTIRIIAMSLAASVADPFVLVIYFAPLVRLAEGPGFSMRAMVREEMAPTGVQSAVEFSTAALGSIAVTATPLGWLLLVPPFVMQFHDSRLVSARAELLDRLATDPLTGVRSRGGWMESVHDAWSGDPERPSFVVMADLDHFKQVNDRHGHAIGDEVLRRAARAMVETVGDRGFVGRFGGEEFTLALRGTEQEAAAICEQLRSAVAQELATWGTTVSLGIAALVDIEELDASLEAADLSVYLAKQSGRDRIARYDVELGPMLASAA